MRQTRIGEIFRKAQPVSWGGALLGGLPFLLYPLLGYEIFALLDSSSLRTWFYCRLFGCNSLILSDGGLIVHAAWWTPFYLFIFVLLLIGWRRGRPRWSAPYIGFGLLFFLETGIYFFPQGWMGSVVILLFLVAWTALLILLARRDPFSALLAALAVQPLFFWRLALDGVIGMRYEVLVFYLAGFVLFLTVMAALRLGRFDYGLLILLAGMLLVNGFVTYGVVYMSNAPIEVRATPTAGAFVINTLAGLLGFALFTLPLWATVGWKFFRFKNSV